MEILEAFDLTGSLRGAAALAGCDHKTVAHYVALRDAGNAPGETTPRAMLIDKYTGKIQELMERSEGKIRADVVHEKLTAMGFGGSERTTRRAVARARKRWWSGHRRVFRPWSPEPGLWLQFDWGDGPRIDGRKTLLFCAWLAWSRFRVVIPTWDRTLPTLLGCVDSTLRVIGGAPTYALTDNEKTVTVEHIARVPVRHPDVVAAGRYYGMSIRTCVPFDPQSKGGAEATVRVAKADLVPTDANLLPQYASFAELQAACAAFCLEVNARVHRSTGRVPADELAAERARLHPLPAQPVTVAFGQTRRVGWDATISVDGARYSVPHQHVDERVWVRWAGDELVVTVIEAPGPGGGAREIARHPRGQRGRPSIIDAHYPADHPGRRTVPGDRTPKAANPAEEAFLAIGDGAKAWLVEAAATGASRMRAKMAEAVTFAKLHGNAAVDQALGTAALAGRFADPDLASILAHQQGGPTGPATRASETHSLQPGTAGWAGFGAIATPDTTSDTTGDQQ